VRDRGTFMPTEAVSTDMRHAGILVGGLESALAFYGDLLGFRDTWRHAP